MKTTPPSLPRFLAMLLGIISLLLANSGSAANLTNDFNAGTAPNPADGGGAWMAANNWWDGTANVSWSAANVAYFGAGVDGAYGINVSGVPSPAAQNLRFNNSGYTLTNDVPTNIVLSATTYQVAVASGKTATIGTNVTLREGGVDYFYVGPSAAGASGTLNIENGGAISHIAAARSVLVDGAGTVVNVKTGGTVTSSGGTIMVVGQSAGSSATMNIQGGTWSSSANVVGAGLVIGNAGTGSGTVNLSSGSAFVGPAATTYGLTMGFASTARGTFNLDGGTLSVPIVRKGASTFATAAVFNFNGGKLVALTNNAAFMTGLSSATVKAGGAIIDDGGFAITIGQALLAGAPSGGLTKLGGGTLTLTGANTYSAGTIVSNGTVLATSLGSGNVDVKAGAGLGAGGGKVATLSLGGNLTLTNSVLVFDITNSANADKITVAGNLTPEGVTTVTLPNTVPPINGDYTLLEVTGTLAGSAANFAVAGPSPKTYTIYYTNAPNRVMLQVSGPAGAVAWLGDGSANQWDIGTGVDWFETGSLTPTPTVTYADNNIVAFDNTATNWNVDITTVVSPASVTVNSTNNYSFTGVGGIAGTNSLVKDGATLNSQGTNNTSRLTLATSNSYSGGTTLLGSGALIVSNSAALGTGPLNLKASRIGSAPTVFLMGGITVTNPIVMDATTSREAITSTNGNNTLTGPVTISGAAANTLIFSSLSGPGSLFTISNSITATGGWANTLGLRGLEFNSGLIAGQVTMNSMIQVLGSANWTIASTNNTWTEARISQGVGGFILGADNAMATNALVRWDSDTSGALDLAGYNQTVAGLYCLSTTVSPGPSVGNSSTTSDSVLKINGNNYTYIGALLDGPGTRKLSVELLSGAQTLKAAASTYSGPTTIKGGTLILNTTASIPNSPVITVASGATFNVSTVSGGYALGAAQTLKGNGTVVGPITIYGTLAPGSSVGTLTSSGALTLQGTAEMEIARDGAVLTNDLVTGITTLNYDGGTLTVTNVGGSALQAGDSFQLFAATTYTGNFSATNLPTLTGDLAWRWNPNNGTLAVVATTPTNLTFSFSGGTTLDLTWPGSHLGWMAQSNSVNLADTNFWFDITGSETVTNLSYPIDTAMTNVFYRLRYQP